MFLVKLFGLFLCSIDAIKFRNVITPKIYGKRLSGMMEVQLFPLLNLKFSDFLDDSPKFDATRSDMFIFCRRTIILSPLRRFLVEANWNFLLLILTTPETFINYVQRLGIRGLRCLTSWVPDEGRKWKELQSETTYFRDPVVLFSEHRKS